MRNRITLDHPQPAISARTDESLLLLAHVADSLSPADPSMQVLFIHVFGHMVGAARTEITPVIRTLHERLVT
jgi:hypothetical protein